MRSTAAAPRLTLGLPVYNGERFLAASLDTLLTQTFTDFEALVVGDGCDELRISFGDDQVHPVVGVVGMQDHVAGRIANGDADDALPVGRT